MKGQPNDSSESAVRAHLRLRQEDFQSESDDERRRFDIVGLCLLWIMCLTLFVLAYIAFDGLVSW